MSEESLINSKRIAKNTVFLYIRTFVILLVSLYTSRVVLKALGIDDYGIYNVVGGFVAMFSLISGALSNAISRYITFELGRGDQRRLTEVFATSVTVQIIMALAIVIIGEIIGIWFLNVKMNIPHERMMAANWVFHCSVLTFAINIISIPYNACIVAHERMNAFAYVSVLEATLKLASVFLLYIIGFDRLIVYAILLVIVAATIRLIYGLYCRYNFEECHFRFTLNRKLIVEMTSLAGWNLLGSGATVLNSHGINIILNLFFGVRVNAARGLANQVNNAVLEFINSFTTAVKPQITKSYAQDQKDASFRLVLVSSKCSFFLTLLFATPLIAETPFILKIWLGEVPDYTTTFVRLALINSLIGVLTNPVYTLVLATGDIRKYQIVIGSLSLSVFFISYFCYRFGMPPETQYYVKIVITSMILYARVRIASGLTGFSVRDFYKGVVSKSTLVAIIVAMITTLLVFAFPAAKFHNVIIVILFSIVSTILTVLLLGFDTNERKYIFRIANQIINKRINHK